MKMRCATMRKDSSAEPLLPLSLGDGSAGLAGIDGERIPVFCSTGGEAAAKAAPAVANTGTIAAEDGDMRRELVRLLYAVSTDMLLSRGLKDRCWELAADIFAESYGQGAEDYE